MKWMRFRVRTNAASEDIIISAMAEIGLYGAEIEDKVALTGRELEELFVDEAPLPVIADDTGAADLACLNFYLELTDAPGDALTVCLEDGVTASPEEIVRQMEEVLTDLRAWSDIGDGVITLSVTEDIDWRDNWKQYFHRFFIDDILILPSWETMSAEDREKARIVLSLDPGAAFGTGLHETTKLAVRALLRALHPSDTVLDVGTGSGILAILALKSGASFAAGVDLDPLAVAAAAENRDRNGCAEDDMPVYRGNLIEDGSFRREIAARAGGENGRFDVVVANILPNVLVPLAPVVPELLKDDGTLVYSGILIPKAEEVEAALDAAGFTVTGRETLGEWCSLTAGRKN